MGLTGDWKSQSAEDDPAVVARNATRRAPSIRGNRLVIDPFKPLPFPAKIAPFESVTCFSTAPASIGSKPGRF